MTRTRPTPHHTWLVWSILLLLPAHALFAQTPFRVATFNASLSRTASGELLRQLEKPGHPQIKRIAEIIREVDPDILLINEIDRFMPKRTLAGLQKNYLAPLTYPYSYFGAVNTGLRSGHDLDRDGQQNSAGDAWGFGAFPGQYGMLILSKFPINQSAIRTFQHFLWNDMPNNLIPKEWYTAAEQAELRLSSKSHWDIPITVQGKTIHLLLSHPTPPVFDGPEDRNGRRNHDEIRFWVDYLNPQNARYIYDDKQQRGGLDSDQLFILCGDLNADPLDGDSTQQPIRKLLQSPRIDQTSTPQSKGGMIAARQQAGANATHQSDPRYDTGDFDDEIPGNLRVDYVLPARELRVVQAKVHWPKEEKGRRYPSDHHLVYLDLTLR